MNKKRRPPRKMTKPAKLFVDTKREVWTTYQSGTINYEVSNYGRVRRYLNPHHTNSLPYAQVYLSGRGPVFIHHLVTEIFVGKRPKGLVINHKDGNTLHNHPDNLEYISQAQNMQAAKTTKLTREDVLKIRELSASGLSHRAISRMYPVGDHQICYIVKRKMWRNV